MSQNKYYTLDELNGNTQTSQNSQKYYTLDELNGVQSSISTPSINISTSFIENPEELKRKEEIKKNTDFFNEQNKIQLYKMYPADVAERKHLEYKATRARMDSKKLTTPEGLSYQQKAADDISVQLEKNKQELAEIEKSYPEEGDVTPSGNVKKIELDVIRKTKEAEIKLKQDLQAQLIKASKLGYDLLNMSEEDVAFIVSNEETTNRLLNAAKYKNRKTETLLDHPIKGKNVYEATNYQTEKDYKEVYDQGTKIKSYLHNTLKENKIEDAASLLNIDRKQVEGIIGLMDKVATKQASQEEIMYLQQLPYTNPAIVEAFNTYKNVETLEQKRQENYKETMKTMFPNYTKFQEAAEEQLTLTDDNGNTPIKRTLNKLRSQVSSSWNSTLEMLDGLLSLSAINPKFLNKEARFTEDLSLYNEMNKLSSSTEIGVQDKFIKLPSGYEVRFDKNGSLLDYRNKEHELIHDDSIEENVAKEYAANVDLKKQSYAAPGNGYYSSLPSKIADGILTQAIPMASTMIPGMGLAKAGIATSELAMGAMMTAAYGVDMYGSTKYELEQEGVESSKAAQYAGAISFAIAGSSSVITPLIGFNPLEAFAKKGAGDAAQEIFYNEVKAIIPKLLKTGATEGELKSLFSKEYFTLTKDFIKKYGTQVGGEFTQEASEETFFEPLIEKTIRTIGGTVNGDNIVQRKTLEDMGFLDPETAIVAGLTGGIMAGVMGPAFNRNNENLKDFVTSPKFEPYIALLVKNGAMTQENATQVLERVKNINDGVNLFTSSPNFNEELLKESNYKDYSIYSHVNDKLKLEESKNELLQNPNVKEVHNGFLEKTQSAPFQNNNNVVISDKEINDYNRQKTILAYHEKQLKDIAIKNDLLNTNVNKYMEDLSPKLENVDFTPYHSELLKKLVEKIELEKLKEVPDQSIIDSATKEINTLINTRDRKVVEKKTKLIKSINDASTEEELKLIEDNEDTIPLKNEKRKQLEEQKIKQEEEQKQKELEEDDMHLTEIEEDLKNATTNDETVKRLNKHIANPKYERVKHKLEEHKNRLKIQQRVDTFETELNNLPTKEEKVKYINATYKSVRNKQFREYLQNKLKEFESSSIVEEPTIVETIPVVEHSAAFDQIETIKEQGYVYGDASEMVLFRLDVDKEGNESVRIFNNLGSGETYLIENNVFPNIPGLPMNLDIKEKYLLFKTKNFGRTLPLLSDGKPISSPQAKPELFDYEFINSLQGELEVELEIVKNEKYNEAESQIILIKVDGKPVAMLPDSDTYGDSTTHWSPEFIKAKANLAQLRIDIFNNPSKKYKLKAQAIQGFFKYGDRKNLTVLGAEKWKFGMKIASGKNEGQFGHPDMPFSRMKNGVVYAITDKGMFIPLITKKLGDMIGMQPFVFQLNEYINSKNFKAAKELIENNKIFSLYLPIDENGLVDYEFAKAHKKLFQYDEVSKRSRIIGSLEEFINESYVNIRPQDLKSKRLIEALETNIEGVHNTSVSINFIGTIEAKEEQKKEEKPMAPQSVVIEQNLETQKADIEKRRQEELFGNITDLEFDTTDNKGRTRKTIVKTKVDENGFKYSFETTVDGGSSSTTFPKISKQSFKESSIYENLDQDSKDYIDELPEDAVIMLQSIAISTDKNSAAGLGNGNITIGYVSKTEGGRIDDIVLKYQPNKINAKYDAELKALSPIEEPKPTTKKKIIGIGNNGPEKVVKVETQVVEKIETVVATNVTLEEKTKIAKEEEIKEEDVYALILEKLKSQSIDTSKILKSTIDKVVKKIKDLILEMIIVGTLLIPSQSFMMNSLNNFELSVERVVSYTYDNFNSYREGAARLAEKKGIINIEDAVVKQDTFVNDSNTTFFHIISEVEDTRSTTGLKLFSYRSQWNNANGFRYIPVPVKKDLPLEGLKINNVIGVGHFLLDASAVNNYSHDYNKKYIKNNIENNQWTPVFTKNEDGSVNLKYKRGKEVNDTDIVISPLRQFKFSDILFNKTTAAKGFDKSVKALITKQNDTTNIIFKDRNQYGRFNGGSVVFIFEHNNQTMVRDFAGSINQIENEGIQLTKQYNLSENQLTLGYHDIGSFSAKPLAKNNIIDTKEYKGFNIGRKESKFTGGALLIPINKPNNKHQIPICK